MSFRVVSVANTIIDQFGGTRRLSLMVNAKNFTRGPDSFSFKFSGSREFTHIRVVLTAADTYTVTFMKFTGTKLGATKEFTDIYADMLVTLFEDTTKLYLSL